MWVRNNKGNVFVGNLPPDFPDERLAEAFDPYGIVLSAVVARDPETGARLRYGFVDIATERAANQAISALDGSEVDGCKLNVKPREKGGRGGGNGRGGKRPGGGASPQHRGPFRPARLRTEPQRNFTDSSSPLRRPQAAGAAMPPHPALSAAARSDGGGGDQRRLSQTERAMEAMPEIEPPPRRVFEVVRRPIRRTATPSFQVERRPLPRRG